MTKALYGASLLVLAAVLAAPAVSLAATADRPVQPAQVAEIIVTAQKRAERLQDVPVSITAITGKDIQNRGVSNLMDLQYAAPGLTITEYAPGQERIELRGISNIIGVNTVGRYFDEMPINVDMQATGPDLRLIDMERVEVLDGPQPTLYGEGSMGGAVRYITAAPDLDKFGASIEGQVGSVTGGGVNSLTNAVVNAPLMDGRLAIRLVGGYENDGGWIDNSYLGRKDINHGAIGTGRFSLLFKPTDNDEFSVVFQHETQHQQAQNFGIDGVTADHLPTYSNSNYNLVTGTYKHEFGGAEFVETAGYLRFDDAVQSDYSGYYGPYLAAFGYGTLFDAIGVPGVESTTVYTDEARLASTGGGPLDWLVGVDYRRSSLTTDTTSYTAPYNLPLDILSSTVASTSESWSGFAQLGYHFTSHLSASVGLRYYEDRLTYDSTTVSFGVPSINTPSPATFHSLNPKATIQYDFSPDAMVYADAAKGFRSGGFNAVLTTGQPSYNPDQLWTYEFGTKEILFDHKADLQADVYYNDWKDVQSTIFPPGSSLGLVENGGTVTGWGVDVAASAHPVAGLTLAATYGWNNLAYRTATADKAVGDPVDFAARETYSVSGDYRRPLTSAVTGFVHLDYQHSGPQQFTERDFGDLVLHIPEKNHVNARVGIAFDRYELSVFGANLTNDRAPIIPGPFGVILDNVEQEPRVVGVNVKAHF